MRRLLILALALYLYSALSYGTDLAQPIWAAHSKVLILKKNGKYSPIRSPDGKVTFSFDGMDFIFRDHSGKILAKLGESISTPELLEVSWSADARAVFVNTSDAGATGTWGTTIFERSKDGLREISIGELIKRTSTLQTDCEVKNVGAIAWLDGHRKLLMFEQVPNSSGCTHMSEAAGYVVDIESQKVLERLNREQVRKRFRAELGPYGRAATSISN